MPITRRQELLAWMEHAEGRFLIEDDYDSEFRFSGRPVPTLQSLDTRGRVIYLNTFSKTIAPALRISYMILPQALLPIWQETMGFYSCAVPSFEQLTLTRFLDGGYFERHVSRMRKHYKARLQALLDILSQPELAVLCEAKQGRRGTSFPAGLPHEGARKFARGNAPGGGTVRAASVGVLPARSPRRCRTLRRRAIRRPRSRRVCKEHEDTCRTLNPGACRLIF